MRRFLVSLVAIGALAACSAESPQAVTVGQVVDQDPVYEVGSKFDPALPDDAIVVDAAVTDVRTGPPLLVELTSGGETIWVEGFVNRPLRGDGVRTALLGSPRPDDQLGLVYPSAGLVDPSLAEPGGWTPEGALGVMIGAVALAVLLAIGVASGVRGSMANRRCPKCDHRMRPAWQTCPSCGTAVAPMGEQPAGAQVAPPASSATILTESAASTPGAPSTPPDVPTPTSPSEPPPAPQPADRGTRIVRE